MSARLDSSLTYRRMTEADVDVIVSIESSVHGHPWTAGNFRDSLAAGYECWIAQYNKSLAAYGVILIAAGEAHLLNLTVAVDWQRRGIGSSFTNFFMKLSRDYGATKIYLEVRPSNVAARALYSGKGFAEVGTRKDYYPTPTGHEDAVIMERVLK